jgi:amidohydrolase
VDTADGFDSAEGLDPAAFAALVAPHVDTLVALRRDLHAHPETGRTERRTTAVVGDQLKRHGLSPRRLPGSGLVCDVGDPDLPAVALRADLDALPLHDDKDVPYRSTIDGVAHACGHDVHTAMVVGAGVVLQGLNREGRLPGRVRLVFQPAEEVQPGGALDVLAAGGLDGVSSIFALHCDPHMDVGGVGLRVGPITSASDHVLVRLSGDGGHTSRPHLTQDLVFALGLVITQLPAVLARRLDPRASVNLTWGRVVAGGAPNAIPRAGVVEGTLRCMDSAAWEHAGEVLADAVADIVRPYRLRCDVHHQRGVPPVVNDAAAVAAMDAATRWALGDAAVQPTEQSLGGEDFGWYLDKVPGALARLGTRRPGSRALDLHQGDFDVDERAISVGVRLLVATALVALRTGGAPVVPTPSAA